jgi:hypothetical protein
MPVNIIITVEGQGSGSGGESRSFPYSLILADPTPLVTLSLSDTTGVTSYFWEMLNQPPFATAVLSSQSSTSPTFTPTATRWGTYLIRCTIIRNGVQEVDEIGLSFRTPNHDLRFPAAGEKIEFDSDDGWALAEFYFWQYVDNLSTGGGGGYWERISSILSPDTDGDTIQVGAGSMSVPSYSYEDDPDTGRRLYNTGIEAFTAGGVDQLLFGNDGGPYIKAADNQQYLTIGNYKTTSGGYSQIILEGVGHTNNAGGKAILQATAPVGKISELNLLSTNVAGNSTINLISNSGSSSSNGAITNIRSEGQGPTSIALISSSSINDVSSIISLSSTSLVGDALISIAAHAPIGDSFIDIGDANTKNIRFSDKNLDDSVYPNTYFGLSATLDDWTDLNTNYGTKTLIEILNTLYCYGGITISNGIGINAVLTDNDYEISVKDAPASEIDFNVLSGYPTSDFDLQTYFNFIQGPTKLSSLEGLVSDGGSGTINIGFLDGLIKINASENSSTLFIKWPSTSALSISDNDVNYITANYATPPTTTSSIDLSNSISRDKILLSIVKRESTSIEYVNIDAQNADLGYSINEKIITQSNYKPEYGTGIIIGGTGTRNLSITPGWMYWGLSKIDSSEFDSSVSSTWTSFYTTDSGSTWTKVLSQTQLDNVYYNDITSGLAALGPNTFGLFWVYRNYSNTDVYVVYGTDDYGSQALAEEVPAPSLVPWQVNEFSYLIGRVVVEEATNDTHVTSVFIDDVAVGAASVHNLLSNIQGGVATERYHLTNSQHNVLTANLPLDDYNFVLTNGSSELITNTALRYVGDGSFNSMALEVDGTTGSDVSLVSKCPDGIVSLGLLADNHNTTGGSMTLSITAHSNDYYLIYDLNEAHNWHMDTKHLLSLTLENIEHSTLTGKQKYLDIYNIHTTPSTDEDSIILITNTAYDTANITIENSATNSSGSASMSIKSLLVDGNCDVNILADSYGSSGGSSSVIIKSRGNDGVATLQLDTDVYFKIDDVFVLRISDFIDPNDETEISVPTGSGDRTLYITNQQANGSAYTSIINKSTATNTGTTEAGLGFICEATETGVESYIQIESIANGATSTIDIIAQYINVSALYNLVLETTNAGNIDINPAASSVVRFGTNYGSFLHATLATTVDWTNFYSTFGNKSIIEAMLTLSGGGGSQSLDDCYNIGESIEADTSPVTISVPSGYDMAALSIECLNTSATNEVCTILNNSNEGNNNGILFQGNAGGGTDYNLYGHKIWSIGSITLGHGTGTGDTTRKSLISCQYDNPNSVDSAIAILESTAKADDSIYARIKTIAGNYGALGGFIEIESTGSLSLDSSSGDFTFGSSLTIDSPTTRIEASKFVVGVNCTMNNGNYSRAYGEYVSTVFDGANHFSLTRKDTNDGSIMGGNGLILTVATSGNETKHFRYKLSDSQDDSYTPFKIPENRIICISGTVVSSCTGSHIDAVYVQKFNWVLWNSTYHADEPGEGPLVVLDRSSWLPTISVDYIATDGWFNLDVTVSGASVGDTVLHVCHITEFTVAETAYVASS